MFRNRWRRKAVRKRGPDERTLGRRPRRWADLLLPLAGVDPQAAPCQARSFGASLEGDQSAGYPSTARVLYLGGSLPFPSHLHFAEQPEHVQPRQRWEAIVDSIAPQCRLEHPLRAPLRAKINETPSPPSTVNSGREGVSLTLGQRAWPRINTARHGL